MSPVSLWWLFLCAIASINVATWSIVADMLERRRTAMPVEVFAGCRLQLVLSGMYVLGCAFRSVLPVYDIPRLGLFDTWLSSVIVGRSVATVAELCFAGQWALILHATARTTHSNAVKLASGLLVPLIACAEACSWYAVLTTSNIGHIAENSIWGLAAALVVGALVTIIPGSTGARRRSLIRWSAAGGAYVLFMFMFDVPTYWQRWVADQTAGKHYMSIAQGLADAAHHRVVSHHWEDWKSEVVWMSLYFSVAVWLSISLVHTRIAAPHFVGAGLQIRRIRSWVSAGP